MWWSWSLAMAILTYWWTKLSVILALAQYGFLGVDIGCKISV